MSLCFGDNSVDLFEISTVLIGILCRMYVIEKFPACVSKGSSVLFHVECVHVCRCERYSVPPKV